MATITKTKAGTFKAIIRKNNRVIKTKTFRLKKDACTWSKRIEGDRDAMMAFGSPGASIQFNQLADECYAVGISAVNSGFASGRQSRSSVIKGSAINIPRKERNISLFSTRTLS